MRKLLMFLFTAIFLFSFLATQSQTRREKRVVRRDRKGKDLVIFAENGQKVFDRQFVITAPYSSMDIDARNLAHGFYIVMVTDAFGKEALATGKVVIQ